MYYIRVEYYIYTNEMLYIILLYVCIGIIIYCIVQVAP